MSHTEQMREALRMVDRAVYIDDNGKPCLNSTFDDEMLQAALTAPAAEVPEAVGDAEPASVTQLRKDFARECADTDSLLRLLGFQPDEVRTDGGSLNLPRLAMLIEARKSWPTEAMLVAGLKECEPLGELIDWREGFGRDEMRAVWIAMCAAMSAQAGKGGAA